jgi:phage terminase large subunit-like protein
MTEPIIVKVSNLGDRLAEQMRAEGVKWYQPHTGQLPFHQSTAKIRSLFGGNRSGKTEAACAEVIMWATGSQKYRQRPVRRNAGSIIWVASESNEYTRDIIVPKLKKWMPKGFITKEQKIQRGFVDFWQLKNGNIINFKNYEMDDEKFEGMDVDLVYLDEEAREEIYKGCLVRTIDRGGSIIMAMTPLKGLTWVYKEIWEKNGTNGIECFLMDMDLNPYLKQVDKDLVLAGLTEEEKKIRKQGLFVQLHGLIYPQFKESRHVIEPFDIPKDWKKVVAVDPHLAKNTSVVWAALADYDYYKIPRGSWVVYRELRSGGIIPDIVTRVLVANGPDKLYARIGDPALNMKDNITGQNPFDVFADEGFPLIPANKKVESGIYEVRKLLDSIPPELYVFRDCIGIIDEFRHYMFSDVQSDKSKSYSERIHKRDDDFMDCLRYIINSGIRPTSNRPAPKYQYDKLTGRLQGIING